MTQSGGSSARRDQGLTAQRRNEMNCLLGVHISMFLTISAEPYPTMPAYNTSGGSPRPPRSLTRLPQSIRDHVDSIGSIDVDAIDDIVDMTGLYDIDSQFSSLPPSSQPQTLPPPPFRYSSVSQTPPVPSQASVPRVSQASVPRVSQASQASQYEINDSQSSSQSVPPEDRSKSHQHWDLDSMHILIQAVHNHNLFKTRNNTERGILWEDVMNEMNSALARDGLPERGLPGTKAKWHEIQAYWKGKNKYSRRATGIVEWMDEYQHMIDDVIMSDITKSAPQTAKPSIAFHGIKLKHISSLTIDINHAGTVSTGCSGKTFF